MTSVWPIIPALFLVHLASYYSQNYAGILASPLIIATDELKAAQEQLKCINKQVSSHVSYCYIMSVVMFCFSVMVPRLIGR